MTRVLVTGGSGFIGRQALARLARHGFEIHALTRTAPTASQASTSVVWHQSNLFDQAHTRHVLDLIKPDCLLHFAWDVEHGRFWHARDNLLWLTASIELIESFAEAGGKRVVVAGTCAEYDWQYGVCNERETPTRPSTLYGACKLSLAAITMSLAARLGLSVAIGRVFLLYGPHEHPARLLSSVILSLLNRRPITCSSGTQIRDFLHVEDIADAFVALLMSRSEGAVNIGSGVRTSLRDAVSLVASKLGHPNLVHFGGGTPEGDPPILVPDTHRLRSEVGWAPRYDLSTGLDQTIDWWRSHTGARGG